jgi:acetyl esterase/lipase
MIRKLIAGVVILAISGTSIAAHKNAGRPAPAEIKVPQDIRYEVRSYREGAHPRAGQVGMAVAKEHPGKNKKLPVVVFIHGGGWTKGDKDQLAWQCIRYAQAGYVAATVSYRLIDESPFPACILDVMEAIRYIKSICPEFAGDPEKIGLQGYSAGAHLALLIALASDEGAFHSGEYAAYDSSVKCAFVISTPTDFKERHKQDGSLNMLSAEQNVDQAFLKAVSPLYYVSADQLPILMVHGTADDLVPSFHYQHFQNRCDAAGVENFKLITEPGGDHMFFFEKRETYQPIMDGFFRLHLKGVD